MAKKACACECFVFLFESLREELLIKVPGQRHQIRQDDKKQNIRRPTTSSQTLEGGGEVGVLLKVEGGGVRVVQA